MTTVTTTSAALDAAIKYFENHPWLRDPEAGKNALRFNLMCEMGMNIILDASTPSENQMRFTGLTPERVIDLALGGDRIAHEALCNVAEHLTDFGRVVPSKLQRYIIGAARSAAIGRRGRHQIVNIHRDEAIFEAVEMVTKQGISATRNEDHGDRQSACYIVSSALSRCGIKMKESAVVTIWRARRAAHKRAAVAAQKAMTGAHLQAFKKMLGS